MKLVSAAFIVTVYKNDLGPDLVLFPALEMLNPSKPDNVFLEAAPCFRSNALLLCTYGNPTIFAHPVENGGSRKETVPFRNAFDRLGSENTGSKTAHFINGMVVSDGTFQRISIKHSGFRFYVAVPHRGSQAARILGYMIEAS